MDISAFFPTAETSSGAFAALEQGSGTLNNELLQDVANFVGAIAIMAGIIFLVVAVVKTREKVRWFAMAAAAIVVGAMLLMGSAKMFQNTAGNTWGEVFKSGSSTIALTSVKAFFGF